MDSESNWQAFFDGLTRLLAHEQAEPVRAPYNDDTPKTLPLSVTKEGCSIPEVVEALVQIGMTTPATSSPQFFNQLFSGRLEIATMADMLAAFFNNSMYSTRSPVRTPSSSRA